MAITSLEVDCVSVPLTDMFSLAARQDEEPALKVILMRVVITTY